MVAGRDIFAVPARRAARLGLAILMGGALLMGCTHKDDRTYFNGRYYPAKAKSIDGDRALFVVTVTRANQGLDGARQAALQAANDYCIKNFGTSDINWELSYDREASQADIQDNKFLVQGRCVQW